MKKYARLLLCVIIGCSFKKQDAFVYIRLADNYSLKFYGDGLFIVQEVESDSAVGNWGGPAAGLWHVSLARECDGKVMV